MRETLQRQLAESIDRIEVLDSHEHLLTPEEARSEPVDLLTLLRTGFYIESDLISAGLAPEGLHANEADLDAAALERICSHLKAIANTSYYQSYRAAFGELFGFESELITPGDWQALSDAVAKANQREDWYQHVLKERGRIRTCLWDRVTPTVPENTDRRFFAPVVRMDLFVAGHKQTARESIEQTFGRPAETLDEYLGLLELAFDRAVAAGAVGIKSGLAYARSLEFRPVARADADRLFTKSTARMRRGFRETSITDLSPKEARQLQDFLMFQVARMAGERGLPLQIHTGMHGGNGNLLARSNPLHLSELILRNPKTTFVLMHGGYPFVREAGILAKSFPHVTVDACWLSQINQGDYRDALRCWLGMVPGTKILAWGGDCARPEAAFGSLLLAKRALARMLAESIEDGWFSRQHGERLAHQMLHDTMAGLYRL